VLLGRHVDTSRYVVVARAEIEGKPGGVCQGGAVVMELVYSRRGLGQQYSPFFSLRSPSVTNKVVEECKEEKNVNNGLWIFNRTGVDSDHSRGWLDKIVSLRGGAERIFISRGRASAAAASGSSASTTSSMAMAIATSVMTAWRRSTRTRAPY
jgi:hypothetical protein